MKNMVMGSIRHADLDGDGLPEEKLKVDFGGVRLTYTQFDASGKPAGQTFAEWSDLSVIR